MILEWRCIEANPGRFAVHSSVDALSRHGSECRERAEKARANIGKGASQSFWSDGVPMVESERQRPVRNQMLHRKQSLARLPRLEGLSQRSRPTEEFGMHPR